MPRLLRPLVFLTCLVVSFVSVFAQGSTVVEPCPAAPAQKPAVASSITPTKIGSKASETVIDSSIADDPAVDRMLAPYSEKVRALSLVIGKTEGDLKKEPIGAGNLGNFVTNAMLREAKQKTGKQIVLAIINAGGLRKNEIAAGQLRASDVFELLPFENALLVIDLSGAQLLKILQSGTRDAQAGARIRFRWNDQNRTEVIGAKLLDAQGERDIDPSAVYSIVTIDYLYNLKSGTYGVLQEAKNVQPLNVTLRDSVLNYVRAETAAGRSVPSKFDDRFVQVGPGPTKREERP